MINNGGEIRIEPLELVPMELVPPRRTLAVTAFVTVVVALFVAALVWMVLVLANVVPAPTGLGSLTLR
ncbi:MAG: hypothetical protein UY56_C0001G0027 [Parcubacteria group bacterium GW2011_GWA1_50_14]|nr:MAG: hypothetical protein UY56_C0001G0027 [Parcubacteria group bacterium GW2011_GWA1_50_14]OGY58722.1 MAG: hypothetical protein A3C03_01775 [Candidatus Colwellbacteria bacterium RIFCSPHIGHO2_02_FULL_45_17]